MVLGAPKAVQSVTLVSGGCVAAFWAQVIALTNLQEKVLTSLSRGSPGAETDAMKLTLHRWVFAKVGGTEKACSEGGAHVGELRAGDFVDVAATIQIAATIQVVSFRLPRGRRGVDVMFVPQMIVQLCSPEQALAMRRSIRMEDELTDLEEDAGAAAQHEVGVEFKNEVTTMEAQ